MECCTINNVLTNSIVGTVHSTHSTIPRMPPHTDTASKLATLDAWSTLAKRHSLMGSKWGQFPSVSTGDQLMTTHVFILSDAMNIQWNLCNLLISEICHTRWAWRGLQKCDSVYWQLASQPLRPPGLLHLRCGASVLVCLAQWWRGGWMGILRWISCLRVTAEWRLEWGLKWYYVRQEAGQWTYNMVGGGLII